MKDAERQILFDDIITIPGIDTTEYQRNCYLLGSDLANIYVATSFKRATAHPGHIFMQYQKPAKKRACFPRSAKTKWKYRAIGQKVLMTNPSTPLSSKNPEQSVFYTDYPGFPCLYLRFIFVELHLVGPNKVIRSNFHPFWLVYRVIVL